MLYLFNNQPIYIAIFFSFASRGKFINNDVYITLANNGFIFHIYVQIIDDSQQRIAFSHKAVTVVWDFAPRTSRNVSTAGTINHG